MNRKLTVILASDIAGYSRLIAEDEEETLRRLAVYRGVFQDLVTHFRGRVFNTAGDSIMAEFPSAVDGLRCAIDVQESVRARNLAYPPSRHMSFRMGMTIGDVVERDGDLLGDGVNVAARLEALAQPGGICISKSMQEAVANKLSASYVDMGLHAVKNIPNPVHVYSVGLNANAPNPHARNQQGARGIIRSPIGIISSFALAVVVGVVVAYLSGALTRSGNPAVDVAQSAKTSAASPETAATQPPAPASDVPAARSEIPSPSKPAESQPEKESGATAQTASKRPSDSVATAAPATSSNGEEDATQLSRLRQTLWANCRSEETAAAVTACGRLITDDAIQGADLALAHERLAYALRKQGKVDEAIAAFTKSLDIAKSPEAYNERGTAYFIKGQLADAMADFSRAIAEDPNSGDAFNNRAWAYYTTGRAQEALADADRATTLSPEKAYVWDTRGHIEERLANRTAAIEDFKKALALDPKLQSSQDALKRLNAE